MNLVLLTYENRSGSTLLAKELNSSEMVCCPESDVLMSIILENSDLDLNPLLHDYKFKEWGIDEDLNRIIGEDMPSENRLYELLKAYAQKKSYESSTVLLKGTEYLYISLVALSRLRSVFNEVYMISVSRDPISIYNSQVRSIHSKTGIPMENNVLRFYKRLSKRGQAEIKAQRVFEVSFEELISRKQQIITSIYRWLDYVDGANKKTHYHIGKSQSHLHTRTEIDVNLAIRQQDNISKLDLFLLLGLINGKINPSHPLFILYELFCGVQCKLRLLKRYVFSLR